MTRKEHNVVQKLIAMLAAGVPMAQALSDATNKGMDMDIARLEQLWEQLTA